MSDPGSRSGQPLAKRSKGTFNEVMMRVAVLLSACLVFVTCTSPGGREPAMARREPEALALLEQGKYQESLAVFEEEAFRADGANYRMLVGAATCEAHLGHEDRFQLAALSAASEAPWSEESFLRLGRMYLTGAERFRSLPSSRLYAELAVEYFRRVFGQNPDAPNLLHNLGLALFLAGKAPSAALMLARAHEQHPENLATLETYLIVLHALGNKKAVARLLEPMDAAGRLPDPWKATLKWAKTPE